MTFDAATLDELRSSREIAIRASRPKARSVTIWVVVVDGAVFVRSVRGAKGQWFVAARAEGRATLALGRRRLAVRVAPVTDATTIEAVSQAYLSKYATSPYAKTIVAHDTLPTTLRLDPAS